MLPTPQPKPNDLREAMAGCGVVFFPIRHHSPACSWHLQRLIERMRPEVILLEGPDNFTELIPLIVHKEAKPPFAVYSTFVDKAGRVVPREEEKSREPARFAGYFPFCGYSPELVALRAGSCLGAKLRFIDLTYPEHVLCDARLRQDTGRVRVESIVAESHLQHSEYLKALTARTGCRDQNDLWDTLFESRYAQIDTEEFIHHVAVYCLMARLDYTAEALDADGTLARERVMAAAITEERQSHPSGSVLVVTGGFHTAGLPFMISEGVRPPVRHTVPDDQTNTTLMRYSQDQLDALNGYASGMPCPDYYQRVWNLIEEGSDDAYHEAAGRLIVQIGRSTRERGLPFMVSPADEIAALQHATLLARIRNHTAPTREDLLDGLRSCFVKGEVETDGAVLMDLVRRVLSGNAVGEVPPGAGVPPLVTDFRRKSLGLRLKVEDSTAHELALDLYRKATHRAISRLLHTLVFLRVPFAVPLGGPDFSRGTDLHLLIEHWRTQWSPATEGSLIEASVYGSTLDEAASARLVEAIRALEDEGKSRSTIEAVRMLARACQMGLLQHLDRMRALIGRSINEDPAFDSVVAGLGELLMLQQSREPLEAHNLPGIDTLLKTTYQRACYLAEDLASTPDEQSEPALRSLAALREALASQLVGRELLDPALLWDALRRVVGQPQGNRVILGGAAGSLFAAGHLSEERLLAMIDGFLGAATADLRSRAAFLRGLLYTCRESAWQVQGLIAALDRLFREWGEHEFAEALPDLRLAFSELTPRETDRVAEQVAKVYGRRRLGELHSTSVTEEDVYFNALLTRAVLDHLASEHLGGWAESASTASIGGDASA